jgi:hypothetical protein
MVQGESRIHDYSSESDTQLRAPVPSRVQAHPSIDSREFPPSH